jgi:transcriptional regulator with XRE-family HTH domain
MADDARFVGDRIAYHRKRVGLSQVEFAGLVGRSESWVSQVERGVRPVDRMSVLQKVADVLSVPVTELRGEDFQPEPDERPEAFDLIRAALTGHPAISALFGQARRVSARELEAFRSQHARVWEMVHASSYTELADNLAALIPGLETAARMAGTEDLRRDARGLLADTYQATAALMAKLGEADAAWIAADRAAFTAEATGDALAVAAAMFRMAHVFLTLSEVSQARRAAATAIDALRPAVNGKDPKIEALSLNGACHLVMAIGAAQDNDRSPAHDHLDQAREIAEQIGEDRDDYGTEFGPSNVAIHAVSVAIILGDAGQALDLAKTIDVSHLSAERRARYQVDLASAHAMRRQIGEAIHDLQQAEKITPREDPHPPGRPRRHPRPAPALRTAAPPRAARTRGAIRSPALAAITAPV